MAIVKKMCAVCGDCVQENVKLVWKRIIDGKKFHICLACAEKGAVCATTVKETNVSDFDGSFYSTIATDEQIKEAKIDRTKMLNRKLALLGDCVFEESDLLEFLVDKNLVEDFYEWLGKK